MTSEPTITVPNLSASRLYSDLQNLHHESLNWQCNLFFDDEINEQTGKPTMKHDLCEVLAREWPFKFPAKYRGLASRTQLVVDLKIAAIQCGFCLFTRNSSANPIDGEVQVHPKTNSMRQAHVSLYCEQGQLHRPMNEQERNAASSADSSVDSEESAGASGCQKYNTSTKKPTEPDYVCPFRLNIYMVSEDAPVDAGRWFVSHINVNKRTCAWHRGHIRLRPSELHNYLTNMSEEEKELAEQCAKLRFSTSSTAALLGSRSAGGLTYQANQISYLSRVVCDIGKHGQSTADRLVSTFSNRTDVCWLMVTFNPEEGLLLQVTAKDRQKLLKLKRNDPEYTKFVKLHSDNKLTGRQKLLLIFMFASAEEIRLLYMHPESISCDVTFGTENTKKQLFDFAAVDGNNKAFNCGRAYIPDGQTWVFWYCFKYCLPVFWGPVVTERLCVMSTDGDNVAQLSASSRLHHQLENHLCE